MNRPPTVTVRYTIAVQFDVPDDFPLTADEVQKTAEWKANDWNDGRLPFTTETMLRAAAESAEWHLHEAVFQHYCRRVEAAFGAGNWHIDARNLLVDRCARSARKVPGPHEVAVEAAIHGRTVDCPRCGQETIVTKYKECTCGATLPVDPATSFRNTALKERR